MLKRSFAAAVFLILCGGFSAGGAQAEEAEEAKAAQEEACPERADAYQTRYLAEGEPGDLVCMQRAMERELSGEGPPEAYECPESSDHYQKRYEASGGVGDLVCMQTALERELR